MYFTIAQRPRLRMSSHPFHTHTGECGCEPVRHTTDRRESIDFIPRVNVTSTADGYELAYELPGMKKEDIKIEFTESGLRVSGERTIAAGEKGQFVYRERLAGKFARTVRFKRPVDPAKISAAYTNGVLTVTVPVAEEARPKEITIR